MADVEVAEVKDFDYYMDHPDEYDALSEAEQAALLVNNSGTADPKGDTKDEPEKVDTEETDAAPDASTEKAAETKTDEPAKVEEPEKAATTGDEPAKAESDPVLLARDGKNIIPYQALVDERTKNATLQQQIEQKDALILSLQEAKDKDAAAGGDTTAAQDEVLASLKEDFPELAELLGPAITKIVEQGVSKGIAEFEQKVNARIDPLQNNAELSAAEAHFKAIGDAHSDYESIVESEELKDWIGKQPSFAQIGYNSVLEKGTAPQVIELLTAFKKATTPPAEVDTSVKTVEAAKSAEKVIEKVKPAVPTSLSDIPASSAVQHDEAEAMASMQAIDLIGKMNGKTPAQVEALLDKLL